LRDARGLVSQMSSPSPALVDKAPVPAGLVVKPLGAEPTPDRNVQCASEARAERSDDVEVERQQNLTKTATTLEDGMRALGDAHALRDLGVHVTPDGRAARGRQFLMRVNNPSLLYIYVSCVKKSAL
jgi:hypothetical protein